MIINKLKKNNLLIYTLALLPLLSLGMVSIAIVLFVLGAILGFSKNENKGYSYSYTLKLIVIYAAPFFLYVISLLWTEDTGTGLRIVEKTLSFIIIPIFSFVFIPLKTSKHYKNFNQIFIVSCIVMIVLTLVYLLINIEYITDAQNSYFLNIKLRQSIEKTPLIGEHPIYFSLLIAVALILLFYNKFRNKILNLVFGFILISGLVIGSSKGVIIAFLLVVIMIAFQNIKKKVYRIVFIILFFAGIGFAANLSPIKTRIHEITQNKYLYPEGIHYNSYNLRMAIYNCTFSIMEHQPILGLGAGDVQNELNTCYQRYNTDAFKQAKYNTHNQYLDYFVSFGFIGFAIVLFCFLYYLRLAYRSENKQYFNFLILFYIAMLTENILVRNTGIVLFTTMNCIMSYPIIFKNYLR